MPKFLRLTLAVMLVLALISLIVFFTPFLKIKEIQITPVQGCLDNVDLLDKFNLANKNILLVSVKKLEDQMKANYPCINTITVGKKFPNKLSFEFTVETSIVQIADSNLFLAKDGLVKEGSSLSGQPILFLPQELKPTSGQKITDKTTLLAIAIADNLSKSDFLPSNIRLMSSGEIAVYNQEGTVAIFSAEKKPDSQVDSLQQVLSKAKMETAKIIKIDLRFDNPVVTYK